MGISCNECGESKWTGDFIILFNFLLCCCDTIVVDGLFRRTDVVVVEAVAVVEDFFKCVDLICFLSDLEWK